MISRAPREASWIAAERPIPLEAPVMITVDPANERPSARRIARQRSSALRAAIKGVVLGSSSLYGAAEILTLCWGHCGQENTAA